MPLLLGIPFTAALAIAVATLSNRLGVDLYWVLAGLCGLWAWRDSQRHDLQRYERTFPLEPRAAGFAVALAWPVAFPWYLRLRHRALTGRLDAHPGRRRYRGLLVALGLVGVLIAGFLLWLPHFMGNLNEVTSRVAGITEDPIEISVLNGKELSITVINSAIPVSEEGDRRRQALRLAREARSAWSKRRELEVVRVTYVHRSAAGGRVSTEMESEFTWPAAELEADTWYTMRGQSMTPDWKARGARAR